MEKIYFVFIENERDKKKTIEELRKEYGVLYQKESPQQKFFDDMMRITNCWADTETQKAFFREMNGSEIFPELYRYICEFIMVRLAYDLSYVAGEKEPIQSSVLTSSQFVKRYKSDDLIIENADHSIRFKEFVQELFGMSIYIDEETGRVVEERSNTRGFCSQLQNVVLTDGYIGCLFPRSTNNPSGEITRFSLPLMSKCFSELYNQADIKDHPENLAFFEELLGYRLAKESFDILFWDCLPRRKQKHESSNKAYKSYQNEMRDRIADIANIVDTVATIPFPDARIEVMKKALTMRREKVDDFLKQSKAFFDIDNLYYCINYVWIDLVDGIDGGFKSDKDIGSVKTDKDIVSVKKKVLAGIRKVYCENKLEKLEKYSEIKVMKEALDLWRLEYHHPLEIAAKNRSIDIIEFISLNNKGLKIDTSVVDSVNKLKGEPLFFDEEELKEYPSYILNCYTPADKKWQQEFISEKWRALQTPSKESRRRILMSGDINTEWMYAAIQNTITYGLLSNL